MRVATEVGEKRVASSQAKGEGPVPLKVRLGKRILYDYYLPSYYQDKSHISFVRKCPKRNVWSHIKALLQVTPLVWIFMAIISVLVLLIILIGLILRARCSQVKTGADAGAGTG